MTGFDWRTIHTNDGTRYQHCHNGKVYHLKQVDTRPRTMTLANIDNLTGEDPRPEDYHLEDLPRTLRRELKARSIRFRRVSSTLAGVMTHE